MSLPSLNDMLDQLAAICKPIVDRIERNLPICQHHYDEYMVAIETISSKLPGPEKEVRLAVAIALKRAGADQLGVLAALRSLGVI